MRGGSNPMYIVGSEFRRSTRLGRSILSTDCCSWLRSIAMSTGVVNDRLQRVESWELRVAYEVRTCVPNNHKHLSLLHFRNGIMISLQTKRWWYVGDLPFFGRTDPPPYPQTQQIPRSPLQPPLSQMGNELKSPQIPPESPRVPVRPKSS